MYTKTTENIILLLNGRALARLCPAIYISSRIQSTLPMGCVCNLPLDNVLMNQQAVIYSERNYQVLNVKEWKLGCIHETLHLVSNIVNGRGKFSERSSPPPKEGLLHATKN